MEKETACKNNKKNPIRQIRGCPYVDYRQTRCHFNKIYIFGTSCIMGIADERFVDNNIN